MPRRSASGHVVFTRGGIRRRYASMDKDGTRIRRKVVCEHPYERRR